MTVWEKAPLPWWLRTVLFRLDATNQPQPATPTAVMAGPVPAIQPRSLRRSRKILLRAFLFPCAFA
jgi:hypothetical protein